MSAPRACPQCGAKADAETRFCSRCGYDVAQGVVTPVSEDVPTVVMPEVHLPPSAAPTPAPAKAPEKRTMFGMPAFPSPPSSGPASAATPGLTPAPSTPPAGGNTMLNLSPQAPIEPPKAAVAPRPAPKGGHKSTVLGMPEVTADALRAAGLDPNALPSQSSPALPGTRMALPNAPEPQAAKGPKIAPTTNRTMLGTVAPLSTPSVGEAPREPGTFGPEGQASTPAAEFSARQRARISYPSMEAVEPSPPPKKKKGNGLLIGLGLVAMVLGVVLAGLAYMVFVRPPGLAPVAAVTRTEAGEALQITIPGAPMGTVVRYGAVAQPLVNGAASFPLDPATLHVGDNPIALVMVRPGASPEPFTVTVTAGFRVRTDLAALSREPPAVDLVFDARPGAQVKVDGASVTLDAAGHGTFPVPLPPTGADPLTVHATYEVTSPPSPIERGEISVVVPLASLVVDRPGASVVTDRATLEIAGAVGLSGTVTIEGESVPVENGRFTFALALPSPAVRVVHVVAREPGKAPRTIEIAIRRVESLEREAAAFVPDRTVDYAMLASSAEAMRGRNVEIRGILYNVAQERGRSDVQILVVPCRAADRCPLWVSYPSATDLAVGASARVLGTAAGTQQFRAQNGQVVTVPRVEATFLLPVAAQ